MVYNDKWWKKHSLSDFNDKTLSLIHNDTYLSFIGNVIFVNTIQNAFDMFICNPNIQVVPFDEKIAIMTLV